MYFEYISLCLFWNWLIYLMPIYCCFTYPDFVLLTGNKSMGWKHVAYLMLSKPCINIFIIHVILFIYVLLFRLWVMILQKKKKWYSFHCIYWYVTYYVLLCRIWSDVSWSLLVKRFYSESFQIMTKHKSSHKVIICHFVRMRHVVTSTLHQEQDI